MTNSEIRNNTAPSYYAALAAIVCSVVLGVHVIQSALSVTPPPIPYLIACVIVAGLQMALSIGVLKRRRMAWSFSLSLHGVIAVVLFFAAPMIRDHYAVSFAVALIPMGVYVCIVFGLILSVHAFMSLP